MAYPDELLPKPNYKEINTSELPQKSYLVRRSSKAQEATVDELGDVRIDAFFLEGDDAEAYYRLYDLSTNLLGVFRVSHLKYVVPWKNNPPWKSTNNQAIQLLKKEEFSEKEGAVPIFLPVHELSTITLPYTEPGGQPLTAQCFVSHDPLCYNFWHYELHFIGPTGHHIRPKESAWRTRAAKHALSSTLKRLATIEEPEIDVLQKHLYTKIEPNIELEPIQAEPDPDISDIVLTNHLPIIASTILRVGTFVIAGLILIKGIQFIYRQLKH